MRRAPVPVTGMGCVTALGGTVPEFWDALRELQRAGPLVRVENESGSAFVRAVGTIGGYWVLTRSTFAGADDAQMEGAVGFPLCDGNTAYAMCSLLSPFSNSAGGTIGFGEYVINGMRPTDWNAEKGMQSIRGVRLEGNRPATRVTAAARGRQRVRLRVPAPRSTDFASVNSVRPTSITSASQPGTTPSLCGPRSPRAARPPSSPSPRAPCRL